MTDVPDTPQEDAADVPDTPQDDLDAAVAPTDETPQGDPAPVPVPTAPQFDEMSMAVAPTNPAALSLLFDLARE